MLDFWKLRTLDQAQVVTIYTNMVVVVISQHLNLSLQIFNLMLLQI